MAFFIIMLSEHLHQTVPILVYSKRYIKMYFSSVQISKNVNNIIWSLSLVLKYLVSCKRCKYFNISCMTGITNICMTFKLNLQKIPFIKKKILFVDLRKINPAVKGNGLDNMHYSLINV